MSQSLSELTGNRKFPGVLGAQTVFAVCLCCSQQQSERPVTKTIITKKNGHLLGLFGAATQFWNFFLSHASLLLNLTSVLTSTESYSGNLDIPLHLFAS